MDRCLASYLFFQAFHGRYEELVLDQAMRIQILFAIDDVEQDGIQQVVLFFRIVLDDDVLQFFQFGLDVVVLVGKRTDVVMFVQLVM